MVSSNKDRFLYSVNCILYFCFCDGKVLIASVSGKIFEITTRRSVCIPMSPFSHVPLKTGHSPTGKNVCATRGGETKKTFSKGETDAQHKDKQGRGLGEEEVLNGGKWKGEGGVEIKCIECTKLRRGCN